MRSKIAMTHAKTGVHVDSDVDLAVGVGNVEWVEVATMEKKKESIT